MVIMASPSRDITDRAKRYRAQSRVTGPKRCVICGGRQNLGVMHLSGNESDGEPANLAYGCKSCNGKLGAAFKRIGAGKPTNQYNPSTGVPTYEQYKWAVRNHTKKEHDEGGAVIHATPKHKRVQYAKMIAAEAAPARRAASAQRRADFEDRWNPSDESVQERSWREWRENFDRVARDPEKATAKDLRRALGYLDKARSSLIRRAHDKGESPNANALDSYDREFEYFKSLMLKRERGNPWPFSSPGRGARQTTPASGGIAHHSKGAGRPAAKTETSAGRYRGYSISKTAAGEFFSSLDPGSWYETKAKVQRAINAYLKGRANPTAAEKRNPSQEFNDRDEAYSYAKSLRDEGLKGVKVSEYSETIKGTIYDWFVVKWIPGKRNPAGTAARYEGKYALYTDAGLVAFGITRKRAEDMAKRVKAGSATVATSSGTPIQRYLKGRKVNPGKQFTDAEIERIVGMSYGHSASVIADRFNTTKAVILRVLQQYKRDSGMGRTNPAGSAAEVFEEFHGFEPSEVVTVTKKVFYHEHLAAAGKLTHLEVWGIDEQRHKISGFKGALLAFNEAKNQLFVEGGDQSINLGDFGIRKPHELETLGRLTDIGYHTNKTHLGDEGGEAVYVHKFRTTNDNGRHVVVKIARYPDLIYDVRNEQLLFSGGSYEILREGINK